MSMFIFLIAGVGAANIRNLLWDDPLCNTFSADGSYCVKCSFRAYFNSNGDCKQVSDNCQTWNQNNGKCKSCYKGWGVPTNGVCNGPSILVGNPDDHCAQYEYVDIKGNKCCEFEKGCKKVCKVCDKGY